MSHEASERVAEPLKVVLDDATPVPTLQVLEDGKSWVLHNVFSETECQNLIAESERLQFDKLTGYRSDYRRNDRLIIDHPELAGVLFERIKFAVPEIVTIDAADHSLGFGLGGIWERDELNYHVRICRYEPGGFFQAHRVRERTMLDNRDLLQAGWTLHARQRNQKFFYSDALSQRSRRRRRNKFSG